MEKKKNNWLIIVATLLIGVSSIIDTFLQDYLACEIDIVPYNSKELSVDLQKRKTISSYTYIYHIGKAKNLLQFDRI